MTFRCAVCIVYGDVQPMHGALETGGGGFRRVLGGFPWDCAEEYQWQMLVILLMNTA